MSTADPRIDTYIANAEPFAQPILTYLRETIHAAVPNLEETLKWGSPAYLLDGKQLFHTASFKSHCALSIMVKTMAPTLAADGFGDKSGMGEFGKITSLKELPKIAQLFRYFKATAKLSREKPATKTPTASPKPSLPIPADLAAELRKKTHTAAAQTWARFTPGKQRDYIEWIIDAKRDATRVRRLTTTLEWLAEGKVRHWKYQNC